MQAARDTCTLERLLIAIFFTQRHQAGHFGLCDRNFLAAEISQADIRHVIIMFLQLFDNSIHC